MTSPIFIEVDKFDHWAQSQYNIPQDDLCGEWECDYEGWGDIYSAFETFITKADQAQWNDKEKEQLLYIIARDNEMGHLSDILPEQALIVLTEYSIKNGHRNDKWQLATQLHKLSDKQLASTLLEVLVNDEDEYVNRRALMELPEVNSEKVEYYAELFWNRNKYGAMDEYQRIAVLHALKSINSKEFNKYVEMARHDGRQYLVENINKLQSK